MTWVGGHHLIYHIRTRHGSTISTVQPERTTQQPLPRQSSPGNDDRDCATEPDSGVNHVDHLTSSILARNSLLDSLAEYDKLGASSFPAFSLMGRTDWIGCRLTMGSGALRRSGARGEGRCSYDMISMMMQNSLLEWYGSVLVQYNTRPGMLAERSSFGKVSESSRPRVPIRDKPSLLLLVICYLAKTDD
jgi:hypothetical protein